MKRLMALIMALTLIIGSFSPIKARAENVQDEVGNLKITLNKLTLNQKDTLSFKVAFTANGKGVKGQRILVQIIDTKENGIQVFEEMTNANGEVSGSVKLAKKQPSGSYFVTATTKFNGVVMDQKIGFTIGVPTQSENFQTDKLMYSRGETVNIQGFAKLESSPVKGAVVPIRIVLNERVVFVGEATTDENGMFKISYNLQGSSYGTYVVYASIPGSTEDELSATFKYSK